ncbi:MAG: PEP-CTERM sorting domain-containing protein [Fibrobacterota bacterium]|nr:PEP-CTERM sorting domain-containing protein [Fibrobacterota bacterium]
MIGKMAKVGFGLVLALVAQSQAAVIYGGYITVQNNGEVIATYRGHSAGYTNELYLSLPTNSMGVIFNNHTTPVGTSANLGTHAAGTELKFSILVLNTGETFFSGPAARNPDGLVHVKTNDATAFAPDLWVGFEDLLGGGDLDYDDVQFSFSNVAALTELPSVPEPTTLGLFGLGIVGLAFAANRRKKA